ncbi:MAG TPA: molybdopterin-dependent oxidoreductase [Nocardioides sp.]|nr:molybdopterin-dependent oxidoreductase [Nocardioides sp.]
MEPGDRPRRPPEGAPVGRRLVLGLLGLGAAGVVVGSTVQDRLSSWLGKLEIHDPTGLTALIPLGDSFRYYSVTGGVPTVADAAYRLAVTGEVARTSSYSLAELHALPQTSFVEQFQCVTGWRVPDVAWSGVPLSTLIEHAHPTDQARAVRFTSFDGTYTESLTMDEAMRPGVIVALQMLGAPVTHDHGGPVRMYCSGMYGYKSTKWLSGIELTTTEIPGYWEPRGYPIDGTIRG